MSGSIDPDTWSAADIRDGDELLADAVPGGLLIRSDSLRKVYVEASGRCNLACAMCPRAAWDATADHMAPAAYAALLDGLPDAPPEGLTLAFGGFGEPTIRPDFLDMVRAARHAARRVEIITNGTTLTPALAREWLTLKVAQVTISVDGGDDPSYPAMRGTPLTPVMDAAAMLCHERRRGRSRLAVGLACVATRRNAASLPALLDTATRLGVDFLSVSNVVAHTPELAADALWSHTAQLSGSHPSRWRPRLMLGRFDSNQDTRPLVERVLTQTRVVPPPALDSGAWHNRCRFAHEGTVAMRWDGQIAPCLSLMYTHPEFISGREKTVRAWSVGNVQDRPLAAIWRDDGFREFRRRVRTFDFSPCLSCGGCDISMTNQGDCFGTPFPACSECLWAQGIVLCP